jgi:hypothetical protein
METTEKSITDSFGDDKNTDSEKNTIDVWMEEDTETKTDQELEESMFDVYGKPRIEDETITDHELANSTFGNYVQQKSKVRMEKSVQEPTTTVRKPKGHQHVQKEDARRETLVKIKKNLSGVLLSKIGPSTNSPIYTEDIQRIISHVFSVDKTALILPHNKNPTQALNRKQFEMIETADYFENMSDMEYKKFFDIQIENWGHRREDVWKTNMSFYIASDVIEQDLKKLRGNSSMESTLTELSLRMSSTTLHESTDEAIGFFLGKSQQHTWRDDLVDRVTLHLQKSQRLQHVAEDGKPNINNNISANLPETIPLSAKLRTITTNEVQADVITLFAGKSDAKQVKNLLEQHPFYEIEIVPYSIKRTHPEEWIQRLRIHNLQVNASRAIKIHQAPDSFRAALAKNLQKDTDARTRVLDITRIKSTAETNVLYVQHNAVDREWVKEWVSIQIPILCIQLELEDAKGPYIDEGNSTKAASKETKMRTSKLPTAPPPPTRFQHILNDPKYSSTHGENATTSINKKPRIPPAIITGPRPRMTYAQATSNEHNGPRTNTGPTTRGYARATTTIPAESKWQSFSSSPDGSTISSVKTQRERELEEELTATSSQLKETQQKLTEASAQLKATKEAHDKLKSLLEESVNNIQTQLKAQKIEMEESLNRRLAEQWHQFQSQFALQDTNPHTTPNLPRKRQDTRLSPYETHGIPQYYPMQAPQYPLQHYYHQYHQPQTYSPNTHPPYSPGQMEQMEDTEWGKTTHHLQEPSQEDGSAEQI